MVFQAIHTLQSGVNLAIPTAKQGDWLASAAALPAICLSAGLTRLWLNRSRANTGYYRNTAILQLLM